MKQAIILAGGKGTRLKKILGNLPKPLVDVCGMPLLERQILQLKKFDFENIIVLVNHNADQIISFCNSKNNWGLDIRCIDDGVAAGTAGAVLKIFELLEDEFLVIYGDTMFDIDFSRFYNFHNKIKTNDITLFIHPNDHPNDSDLVEMNENGKIVKFHPYPHDQSKFYPNLVNAALYCVKKRSLKNYKLNNKYPFDFGKDLFPKMIEDGLKLYGYNSPEYIKDCGTPERINRVSEDLLNGKISKFSLSEKQKAIFLDRDGTINYEVGHLSNTDKFKLIEGVETAIKQINKSEYKTIVITNQPVIARGDCSFDQLNSIHNKMESLLGNHGAYLDRIYFCPHHNEKGFKNEIENLKINCDCRKPKVGMITNAVNDLNIDLSKSWFIGDTTTDILTAKNASVKSILIQTGYSGLDEKFNIVPDFIMPNLNTAVDFIINRYEKLIENTIDLVGDIKSGSIIYIGGQSRSGKSSLASIIKHYYESKNMICHVISTDFWLMDHEKRGVGVLNRHDNDEILKMIITLENKRTEKVLINTPSYKKVTRKSIINSQQILIEPSDIIIVEGVVSLYFANLRNSSNKFFVEINEDERKQRVISEYLKRGNNIKEAEKIYVDRFLEEVPWVNSTAKNAKSISIS